MPTTSKEELVEFLKQQENAALAAGDMSYMRHASPEGGTDTVGFGHKLTPEEEKTGIVYGMPIDKLDTKMAEAILRFDIAKHEKTLDRSLQAKHGIALTDLSPRKQMMLLDYEFNLGSATKKFPSFTAAVLAGDEKKQLDEMTRHFTDPAGVTKPLARNRHFYNAFMSTDAKARLGD